MTVSAVKRGSGTAYVTDTGETYPRVSNVLGMYPKEKLMPFYARQAATYAVDHRDELAGMPRAEAITLASGAAQRYSNKAANDGTRIHSYVEQVMRAMMAGTKPSFAVSADDKKYLRNFVRFVKEFEVEPVMLEALVWSDTHRYAGRLDAGLKLTIGGKRGLYDVDTKTGASGVWPEAALQQTAYVNAEYYLDATGKARKLPRFKGAFALWLRPDGYALIPLSTSEANWQQFLRLRDSYEWKQTHEDMAVGKAINTNPLQRKWKGER